MFVMGELAGAFAHDSTCAARGGKFFAAMPAVFAVAAAVVLRAVWGRESDGVFAGCRALKLSTPVPTPAILRQTFK